MRTSEQWLNYPKLEQIADSSRRRGNWQKWRSIYHRFLLIFLRRNEPRVWQKKIDGATFFFRYTIPYLGNQPSCLQKKRREFGLSNVIIDKNWLGADELSDFITTGSQLIQM